MNWEPWTGCYKVSEGCNNCNFYGPNSKRFGQNAIVKTDKFDHPIRKNAKGEYNIKGNKILATCFATDFFLPEADEWRKEVWAMIRERQDIEFLILTKRRKKRANDRLYVQYTDVIEVSSDRIRTVIEKQIGARYESGTVTYQP